MTISLDKVTKTYRGRKGDIVALDETSLFIGDGEFVSIVGPSGCGKSTLLMMLAGLETATSGTLTVNGRKIDRPQTDLGFVFQQDVLLAWRTVLQNVMLQAQIRRLDPRQSEARARELLAMVGLDGCEQMYPHELSGGMRQRVSICRALLHRPSLLLMDEPFGALDAITRDQLHIDLKRLCEEMKITTVFVTHSIEEAVFLSDRVVVMTPRPSTIKEIITIDLPGVRKLSLKTEPAFGRYTSEALMVFERTGVIHETTH